MEALELMLGGLATGVMLLVISVILFVALLIKGISICALMSKNGVSGKWMAFIPVLNDYILGTMFSSFTNGAVNPILFAVLPYASIVAGKFGIEGFILGLIGVVSSLYYWSSYYKVGRQFNFGVPALILSLLKLDFIAIFVFASRIPNNY